LTAALSVVGSPDAVGKSTTNKPKVTKTTKKHPTTRLVHDYAAPPITAPSASGLLVHPLVARDLETQIVCRSLVTWLRGKLNGEVSVVKGSPEACAAFVDTARKTPSAISDPPKFDMELRFVAVPLPPLQPGSKWSFPGANLDEPGFVDVTADIRRVLDTTEWLSGAGFLRQFRDGTVLRVTGSNHHLVQYLRGPAKTAGPARAAAR
jgi:hypothetical protein